MVWEKNVRNHGSLRSSKAYKSEKGRRGDVSPRRRGHFLLHSLAPRFSTVPRCLGGVRLQSDNAKGAERAAL